VIYFIFFLYDKILRYIEEKGYILIDDSIEITLIDFGLTTEKSEFITEIQMLIN
jgi:effector-binding domain-containing protein